MANIVELIIRGDDQSARAIASSVKGLQGMDSALSAVSRRLAGIVSVGALASLAKSAIDTGSELSDMSQKFGIAASDLSALSYPAKMAGVDIEGVGNAIKFMQKNIAEASNPTSDQARALKLLGVSLDELKGKLPMEQFLRLSDAFSRLERDENRTAIALTLFGRAGADVLPVIEKGSVELNRMMQAAKDMGAAMSEEEIAKLDHYGDVIDMLGIRAKATAGRGLVELIDKIKAIGETAAKYGPAIEGIIYNMGLIEQPGPGAKRFKAPPLPTSPPKVKAGSLEEEKAGGTAAKKAAEDAKKERERLDKEYLQLHAKNIAEEGKLVHEALAAEMGMDEEYFGTVSKMRMDDHEEWKRVQEEEARLTEKYYSDKIDALADLQDAQRAEMEITEPVGPYLAEDAFNAAMAYGDAASAVRLLNDGLFEQFRIIDEGREKVYALQNLYSTVFRGKDGMIADLANAAVDAFHSMTDALTDFAMTGKANFRDFANSVIADLMRIAIQQSIVGPLAQGLMGALGFNAPVGAGKAAGGPVYPGMVYPVGERGIELFAPSVPGTIIPNGAGGGQGNVTVNIRNQSGTPVSARASSSFDLQGAVIDIVLDGISRNVGGMRTALGGA